MAKNNSQTLDAVNQYTDLERHFLVMRDSFRFHQNNIRKKYKISANEMEIILFISDHGPQRMKNVGERFGIKFSTLTSLVDKIERLNLVRRVNSKEDRRSILITLTKKGRRMIEDYNSQVRQLAANLTEITGEDKVPELTATLEKVLPTLE